MTTLLINTVTGEIQTTYPAKSIKAKGRQPVWLKSVKKLLGLAAEPAKAEKKAKAKGKAKTKAKAKKPGRVKAPRKVKAKKSYVPVPNPADPTQVYPGTGRKPAWLKALQAAPAAEAITDTAPPTAE